MNYYQLRICLCFVLWTGLSLSLKAQEIPSRSSLAVVGNAEISIVPDMIYLNLALQEYMEGSEIVEIQTLESDLIQRLEKMGIPPENLQLENLSAFQSSFDYPNPKVFVAKTYSVLLNHFDQVDQLRKDLQNLGLTSFNLSYYSHSQMDSLMAQLKKMAWEDALKQAKSLSQLSQQKLGNVISIDDYNTFRRHVPATYTEPAVATGVSSQASIRKAIFLNYSLRAIFEIE